MSNPDDHRLPIKLDTASNGEYPPIALEPVHHHANQLALEDTASCARRLGLPRRKFLVSACGAATSLLAINRAYAADSRGGGFFDIPQEAALDMAAAQASVAGDEFIFDVQGHFVNPEGAWVEKLPPGAQPYRAMGSRDCNPAGEGELAYLQCAGSEAFIKDVFLDSDTDMMVLSFVPSKRDAESLTIEEAVATREIVERMEGTKRLLVHGRVNPNQDGDMQDMDELAARWGVAAWKTYTQWGPDGRGYYLSDDVGLAFIEKARRLGVKTICIHKGIPFGRRSYEHSLCTDIGVVAKQYPDVNFLVYHSGYVPGQKEGPYRREREEGIDGLITSVLDNGVAQQGNVYAELGSTWRLLMRDPNSAAHSLGKLFKHLGPDNVLWGSDSLWYGSPQDQIQAFRTFQISEAFQQQFGYAAISPEVRAKVFGLNAAHVYEVAVPQVRASHGQDSLAQARHNYEADPHFRTYGPKTRREFLALKRLGGSLI